jgi:hypothetical protein
MTAPRIGCLAAGAPARRFYEALGGRVVGEREFDEGGVMLPLVVYGRDDTRALGTIGRSECDVHPEVGRNELGEMADVHGRNDEIRGGNTRFCLGNSAALGHDPEWTGVEHDNAAHG